MVKDSSWKDASTKLETLADRVEERQVGPCRLLMVPTPVRGVVSWSGSIRSDPGFAAGDELVQVLTVRLLDKGTQHRDRFVLAGVLERCGAELDFSNESLRIGFSGRALRDDLPDVLAVMAEELREPLFDADEFDKAQAQYAAVLQRAMENTGRQALGALTRRLYDPAHPNYSPPPEELLARLAELTPEQVRTYHAGHFGANDLLLVLVGDLDPDAAAQAVSDVFGDWSPCEATPAFKAESEDTPPGEQIVRLPDKQNVDVRMGHAVHLRRQDDDYVPLYLANHILGGNFSARLMTEVRNRLGLTYGIGSALSGVTTECEGHWQVAVTLSRDSVARGVAATRAEVRRFVENGATEDELDEKKTTITGSFKVGLATTGGLANTLHRNATRGFDVHYLDRFPEEVEAVTLDTLHDVVRQHFDPDALHTVYAGTVDEEDGYLRGVP